MSGPVKDMVGQRFGRLLVLSFAGIGARRLATWLCRCDCGNEVTVVGSEMRRNRNGRKSAGTSSCGCLRVDAPKASNTKHSGFGTRLYHTWGGMKARCYDESHIGFKHYGERGINVCAGWVNDFPAFREWAMANGYDDTLTIDRINNDLGYFPENCRWAPHAAQSNNRRCNIRLTFNGETRTLADWSRSTGMHRATIASRLRSGWSVNKALTISVRR